MSRSPGEYQAQAPAAGQRTTVRRPAHLYRVLLYTEHLQCSKGPTFMYKLGPTFMYNWLRPVSTKQAPTRSRPAGVRAVGSESAGSMSAGPRPPTCILYTDYSLHSCTHSSYYYIHVYIQVILHALHSFTRGPAHRCQPRAEHSCTPKYLRCKGPTFKFTECLWCKDPTFTE